MDKLREQNKDLDLVAELSRYKGEIERLKEENAHFAWRDKDKNKLINELASTLISLSRGEDVESNLTDLNHRAWKATNGMGDSQC